MKIQTMVRLTQSAPNFALQALRSNHENPQRTRKSETENQVLTLTARPKSRPGSTTNLADREGWKRHTLALKKNTDRAKAAGREGVRERDIMDKRNVKQSGKYL